MSFSKLTWHKRTHGHEFTGAEFRVLMAVFDYSDEHGRKSHPGLKRLMADTGYGRTAVSEALTALQERGWVTQTHKGSGTSGKTSVYELVPDAPSGTAGADQPQPGGSTAGADQPTEVGPVERTSWSAGADTVGPLERTPSDPDTRSGSDPFTSDPEEVRYPPNHLEDQDETGLESRSLADAGSEAPEGADGVEPASAGSRAEPDARPPSRDSDPWGGSASEPATAPEGLVGLRPPTAPATATAAGSPYDDPFSPESLKEREELAAEEAARKIQRAAERDHATAWS